MDGFALQHALRLTGPIPLAPLPQRPLVSVLMANYNYARYIPEAIASVLGQTYENVELIVCDDGSTDDSCDVIERFVRRDPRVRLVRKTNGGMASAWNAALPYAKGEVICLLDADDVFRPGKLEVVIDAFRRRPASGLLVHAMTVITAAGDELLQVPFLTPFEHGWIADRVVRRGGRWRYMPTSSLAFRRALCPYVFPLDERLFFRHAESLILTLGPLLTEVTAVEESLTGYRVHGANRTGGHAHDRKTARRAVDNVAETIEGTNARLAALELPQRLDLARNLEYRQAAFLLALLDGQPRLRLARAYLSLWGPLAGDDLYGPTQKALGLFVYGAALVAPVRARPWWLEQTLGFSPIKQRLRKVVALIRRRSPSRERARGKRSAMPARLFDVLGQIDGACPRRDWICERIGRGEQGCVYTVRRGDGSPAYGGEATLVVKLYDASKPWALGAARDQRDVLALLQTTVAGARHHGWTVHCPVPLLLCVDPLALVMSHVSGRPLGAVLGDANVDLDGAGGRSLARALAAALQQFWSETGRVYGELNFDNVLCDPSARTLSLIDPGMARPARLCVEERGRWYPAAHDLAYLLYAVSAGVVKACAARPARRDRHVKMTRRILGEACNRLTRGPAERAQLLDEVAACARVHLGRIRVSWRPGGIWRRIVRHIAARTIARVIDGLRESSRELPCELPCELPRELPRETPAASMSGVACPRAASHD